MDWLTECLHNERPTSQINQYINPYPANVENMVSS